MNVHFLCFSIFVVEAAGITFMVLQYALQPPGGRDVMVGTNQLTPRVQRHLSEKLKLLAMGAFRWT